ncbi:MAG: DUF1853 family protein [Fluviicola sp.]|nr:DUF1853 family protein [Fluviicola sp.]
MSTEKEIQEQFSGFLSTPLLWENRDRFGLEQYAIINEQSSVFKRIIKPNLPLGKRVEVFLSHLLHNDTKLNSISENIQIQREKRTLGELDFIFNDNESSIHLEVVYKFYLLDINAGKTDLEQWVGPNRKDSLSLKIEKLRTKQLPRLHLPETASLLQEKGFNQKKMKQYVHFQAQLFVPFGFKKSSFQNINPECINGFYISLNQLREFRNCEFYIPSKVNWLIDPTLEREFIGYEEFEEKVVSYLNQKRSPLCWLKDENNHLSKFFIVWW